MFFFIPRLPDWAEKVMKPNGDLENISKLIFKMDSATPELARLRSGFLIKEILEHFTQKINQTLDPDRSLWLYSAHDFTISNVLNSLGLFEVFFFLIIQEILINFNFLNIFCKQFLPSFSVTHSTICI